MNLKNKNFLGVSDHLGDAQCSSCELRCASNSCSSNSNSCSASKSTEVGELCSSDVCALTNSQSKPNDSFSSPSSCLPDEQNKSSNENEHFSSDSEIIFDKHFDVDEVMELIPHRYPMLLIDGVSICTSSFSAVGFKKVDDDAWFLSGHFPSYHIMPGVLIIEALAQTAAVLAINHIGIGGIVKLLTVDGAKFRKPVLPECMLELHVNKISGHSRMWRFSGKAMASGVVVAECTFAAILDAKLD